MGTQAQKPSISVIIPVRNAAADLERCLASLQKSTFRDYECIVVDDASTDQTAEVAEGLGSRVIRLPSNVGPAVARNRAAREARGEILFFVDSDVLVKPDTLQLVHEGFHEVPQVDAVIGSYDDDPAQPDLLSQYKNLQHHFTHQTAHEEAFTFWSGCGAIRRKAFADAGGFAESYQRPSIEDIEFGYRFRAAGRRIRLDKRIQVKHLKAWTFWKLIRTDVFDRGVPWTELILRSAQMPGDLNLKVSQRVCVTLVHLSVLTAVVLVALSGLTLAVPLALAGLLWLFSYWTWDAFSGRQAGKLAAAMVLAGATAVSLYAGGSGYHLGLFASGLAFTVTGHSWAKKGSTGTAARIVAALAALGLAGVMGAIFMSAPWAAALAFPFAFLVVVVTLNLSFYRFLSGRHHLLFTITALPLHLLYYYYSGLSFLLGVVRHFSGGYPAQSSPKSATPLASPRAPEATNNE